MAGDSQSEGGHSHTPVFARGGAVLKRLDQHGLRDNTLVIFTSDNGTTHPGRDPKFHIGGVDAKLPPVFDGSDRTPNAKTPLPLYD